MVESAAAPSLSASQASHDAADRLLDGVFEALEARSAADCGVEAVELVGDPAEGPEVSRPAVAVRGAADPASGSRATVLVLAAYGADAARGTMGISGVELLGRRARAGVLAGQDYGPVEAGAPILIVHPAPDAAWSRLARSIEGSLVPDAEHAVGFALVHLSADRPTKPAPRTPHPDTEPDTEPDTDPGADPDTGEEPLRGAPGHGGSRSAAREFALAANRDGDGGRDRPLSPEEREARLCHADRVRELASKDAGKGARGVQRRIRRLFTRSSPSAATPGTDRIVVPPVSFPTLDDAVIRRFRESPYPVVCLFLNNKGGVGKTAVTIGTAAATSQMGRGALSGERLRTLVVEQNFQNPNVESRLSLKPGSIRGLGPYLEDLLAEWEAGSFGPDGEPKDLRGYTARTYVEGLDALLIGNPEDARRISEDYLSDGAFEWVFREFYRSLGAAYDVVCVDLANSRPETDRHDRSPNARLISLWASAADVIFVIFDASKTSFEQARLVVEEARQLCAYDNEPGVPPPPAVVPILNAFPERRPHDEYWMEDDERLAHQLEREFLPAVGADLALLPPGPDGPTTLKIPAYKEAGYFANAGRVICLASQRFADAFAPIVVDLSQRGYDNHAVRSRIGG